MAVRRLCQWVACGSLHNALRAWTDEAEAQGWPRIWQSSAGDYKRFRDRMEMERSVLTRARMEADPGSVQWRQRHPEWRPDFSPEDEDVWELSMLGWHTAIDLGDWRLTAKVR